MCFRKTGTGRAESQWGEIDDVVLSIIGKESAVLQGLPVEESGEDFANAAPQQRRYYHPSNNLFK
ncbi:MAG: hypothetical protein GY820_44285 [Gammaproteobacteria bacterium]|nr:hypothetical protein [Gammaproteobacteria bacterium]